MVDLLRTMDKFGPEKVICVSDPKVGMKGVLVIDNTSRGMGKGGCRMSPNLTISEVCRLARTMTWKWAMVDFSLGGAKGGIMADPNSPNKEEILRSYINALKKHIPSEYVFGLDMGLSESDAAIVVDELDDLSASMGKPVELGGFPYDELGTTGYGVAEAADIAAKRKKLKPGNTTVSIQGFGAVGQAAAKFLAEKGYIITGISTVEGALFNPNGLDVEELISLYNEVGEDVVNEYSDGETKGLGEELLLDVDILIPAAIQDVITEKNADEIKAKIIVEGANMPTTEKAELILNNNDKLIIPDFVANSGGVIAAAVGMDSRHSCRRIDTQEVYSLVKDKMNQNVSLILDRLEETDYNTREISLNVAQERVIKAMRLRGNKIID
ncbi:MAG: Glu/Leu/Phe/Val family dehydrogenase [Bacillota bacterium]